MDVEDLFGDHGAAHQRAKVLTQIRDDGDHRIAQNVAEDDRPVAHALGACGAHIIERDVRRDLGTGQADDIGHRDRSQHHRWHQQVEEARVRARRDRQDAPLDAQEILAQEAGDEGRHRDEQQRDDQDHRVIPLALLEARDDTKHTSEDGFEAECHERELDRHGERATNLVDDRLSGEGVAEVECERVLQEQQILHQERLVQIVFRADLGGDGFIDRLVSEHRLDRIARQREDQRIHQQCRTKNHRDHLQNASQKIFAHRFLLIPLDPVRPRRRARSARLPSTGSTSTQQVYRMR